MVHHTITRQWFSPSHAADSMISDCIQEREEVRRHHLQGEEHRLGLVTQSNVGLNFGRLLPVRQGETMEVELVWPRLVLEWDLRRNICRDHMEKILSNVLPR